MDEAADFVKAIQKEFADAKDAIRGFEEAALAGDVDALHAVCARLNMIWQGWPMVIRRASRMGPVPDVTKACFKKVWLQHGHGIRDDVGSDTSLIAGLRALLPPYHGPGLTLYRGDSDWNRRRRTYGLSWSSERDVANASANALRNSYQNGSVVLEAHVPPEAIISKLHDADEDRYGEREYLVDRRRLTRVRLVARYLRTEAI